MADINVIVNTPEGGRYPAIVGHHLTVKEFIENIVQTVPLDETRDWRLYDKRTGRELHSRQTFETYPENSHVEFDITPAVHAPREPAPVAVRDRSRLPVILWCILGFVLVSLVFVFATRQM